MSIGFQTVQESLSDFVQAQLGLANGSVRWADQNAPEPAASVRTWIDLDMGDLTPVGAQDGAQIFATANPDPDTGLPAVAGAEVTIRSVGLRTLPFSIQAYTRDTAVGTGSARELLGHLLDILRSREGAQALLDLGVGVSSFGGVRNLTALVNSKIQGRAILELTLNLPTTLVRKVGYIATVTGTLAIDGGASGGGSDFPFSFDVPAKLPPP